MCLIFQKRVVSLFEKLTKISSAICQALHEEVPMKEMIGGLVLRFRGTDSAHGDGMSLLGNRFIRITAQILCHHKARIFVSRAPQVRFDIWEGNDDRNSGTVRGPVGAPHALQYGKITLNTPNPKEKEEKS
jgi:hypothetical protein